MGYIIAFMLGACLGIFVLSLCMAAGNADKNNMKAGATKHADAPGNQDAD